MNTDEPTDSDVILPATEQGVGAGRADAKKSRRRRRQHSRPLLCEYCGLPIESVGQTCPALADGRCCP